MEVRLMKSAAKVMLLIAGAAALALATAEDAAAARCLNWREFRATDHKVKIGPHCWRAAEQRRRSAATQPASPATVPDAPDEIPAAATQAPEPAYPIGRMEVVPDPASLLPAWQAIGRWPEAQAVPASLVVARPQPGAAREAPGWPPVAAAVILALIVASAWAAARRSGRAVLTEPEPIDMRLMPAVLPRSHVRIEMPPVRPPRPTAAAWPRQGRM
jgi:hypothetical protein